MALETQSRLSTAVQTLQESATLKMSRIARELKESGHDVISLSIGEPDFDTPQHIKDAACKALDDGYTKYTPVPGLPEIRNAISQKFKRDNHLDYPADQIIVSNGAKQSIANIVSALINPGDKAILFAPYWVSYIDILRLAGGDPIVLNTSIHDDFKVKPEQLEEALSNDVKFVLFSSPCNPTGSVYSAAELHDLARVLEGYPEVLVVSDEIYEYINYTGNHVSIGSIDSMRHRTATVNGFSKGFAMTGWRLGYMGGPKWLVSACTKVQGQCTSGATAFGQIAGAHALMSDLTPTHEMKEAFLKRKQLVRTLLAEIPGIITNDPQGAFYIFPNVSAYFGKRFGNQIMNNADDLSEYILHKGHVATVSGAAFGNDQCIRISFAASEAELRKAIKRIGSVLGDLAD